MIDNLKIYFSQKKGAVKSCSSTSTWIAQRVSALALIPLTCWFVIFLLEAFSTKSFDQFESIFTSPFPSVFLCLFIAISIYHGTLGIKEIIEDYVHCNITKIIMLISVKFISAITAILSICAILVLHLSTFIFN